MGNVFDFIQGQIDCKEGFDAKENMSEYYYRGYDFEYWSQSQKDAMTDV